MSLTAQALGSDGWTRTDHLLALILDELRTANWQRSKDGSKNRNRPKPVSPLKTKGTRVAARQRPFSEVKAYLDQFDPAKQTRREVTRGY